MKLWHASGHLCLLRLEGVGGVQIQSGFKGIQFAETSPCGQCIKRINYHGTSVGVSSEWQNVLHLLQQENELIASWKMRIQNQVALCKYQNFADKHMGDQFIVSLCPLSEVTVTGKKQEMWYHRPFHQKNHGYLTDQSNETTVCLPRNPRYRPITNNGTWFRKSQNNTLGLWLHHSQFITILQPG